MLLDAIRKHNEGIIALHKANIAVYLKNPAGIGEHSDIHESIDKELEKVAVYDDRLTMIAKYFERKQIDEKEEKSKSK